MEIGTKERKELGEKKGRYWKWEMYRKIVVIKSNPGGNGTEKEFKHQYHGGNLRRYGCLADRFNDFGGGGDDNDC